MLFMNHRSIANLAQFAGHASANIITRDLGSYAWPLWISAAISLLSLLCAIGVLFLDNYLRRHFVINDKTGGGTGPGRFTQGGRRQFSTTFWIVVLFCVFENAGVQSFVSISTFVRQRWHHLIDADARPCRQFAQQRLKKGAVVGGWVSSFYLLLPAVITPFLGIFIDAFGRRVSIRTEFSPDLLSVLLIYAQCSCPACSS
jgi:MFS family permease